MLMLIQGGAVPSFSKRGNSRFTVEVMKIGEQHCDGVRGDFGYQVIISACEFLCTLYKII